MSGFVDNYVTIEYVRAETNKPVIDGRVALFPRTLRWRLDFNSPPSTTTHLTVSVVFDFTASDIIPPVRQGICEGSGSVTLCIV
jgi:hypothetical protein